LQTTVDACVRLVYCKLFGEATLIIIIIYIYIFFFFFVITLELHLSILIGTASLPDMQKIQIIGLSLNVGYIGSLKFGFYYLQYVPVSIPFDHA